MRDKVPLARPLFSTILYCLNQKKFNILKISEIFQEFENFEKLILLNSQFQDISLGIQDIFKNHQNTGKWPK